MPRSRPQRLAKLVHGHWSVKNRCNRVLDGTFREDHCQVRDKNGAHNLSIRREMFIKAPRSKPSNLSLRKKRHRSALALDFRLKTLSLLHA